MRQILDKKGLSEMVAYVLLVIIAIGLSIVVYAWVKSQVPVETSACPEGASLIMVDYNCEPDDKISIDFENKGLFSLDGFFIRAGNVDSENVAVHPLKLIGIGDPGYVPFDLNNNLKPGEVVNKRFDYSELGEITSIEISPFKFDDNKKPLICKSSISRIEIQC